MEAWPPTLVIELQVYGRSFHINLAYGKPVSDHLSGLDFMSATWLTGFIGQHAGNPDRASTEGYADPSQDVFRGAQWLHNSNDKSGTAAAC